MLFLLCSLLPSTVSFASLRWFNSSGGPYLTSAAQRLHPSMSSMPVNCHWSLEIGCLCRCWHCSLHQPRTPRGARLPCSLPSRPVVAVVAVKGSSSLRADHAKPACMRPPESFAPAPLFTAVHTNLHASIRSIRRSMQAAASFHDPLHACR